MKCPFCSSQLKNVKSGLTFLDVCPDCGGIWFGSGDFGDFVETLAESEDISPEKTKLFHRREVRSVFKLEEEDRFCPKCNTKLEKFNYCGDSNVFLDKCPSCGGIWADGGEAKRIARYIKEDPRVTEIGSYLAKTFETVKDEQGGAEEAVKYAAFLAFFPKVIIPLGSDICIKRLPIVTILLMIFCILFFVFRIFFDPSSIVEISQLVPEEDFRNINLLSSMFLIGSLLHLIWDVLFLWILGSNVEYRFSRLGYLMFFILCGIFSSLLYSVFNWSLSVVTVGISGAVAGVVGAYFIFYPTAKIRLFIIYRVFKVPTVVCLGAWFVVHLIGPFLPIAGDVAKTAWLTGILGFFIGMTVAFIKKDVSKPARF